ncbi:hypothetical protein H8K47_02110 [Undibacterium sp. CY7W]|uniref:DUF2975 domain-containing protein n=1 Tax=Undibacterium rugosum TaxID=2762291 RepID=A0A923KY79_9BURK|nr:hypothetical protein [Undibacterium rugosum]MBC3934145.1 hypothetical protein [Undibacterium rugosum]
MSLTSRPKAAHIRQLSRYFLWLTTSVICLLPLSALGFVVQIWMAPSGQQGILSFFSHTSDVQGMMDLARQGIAHEYRWMATTFVLLSSTCIVWIFIQLNNMLVFFYQGEIFNRQALRCAQTGFWVYLAWTFGIYSVQLIAIILTSGSAQLWTNFADSLFVELVNLGIAKLLVWALEIGTELNEDAALVI